MTPKEWATELVLESIPANGTWSRQLRRWNVKNGFFITKVIFLLFLSLVIWLGTLIWRVL